MCFVFAQDSSKNTTQVRCPKHNKLSLSILADSYVIYKLDGFKQLSFKIRNHFHGIYLSVQSIYKQQSSDKSYIITTEYKRITLGDGKKGQWNLQSNLTLHYISTLNFKIATYWYGTSGLMLMSITGFQTHQEASNMQQIKPVVLGAINTCHLHIFTQSLLIRNVLLCITT